MSPAEDERADVITVDVARRVALLEPLLLAA